MKISFFVVAILAASVALAMAGDGTDGVKQLNVKRTRGSVKPRPWFGTES